MTTNAAVDWSDEDREKLIDQWHESLAAVRAKPTERFRSDCDITEHAPSLYLAGRLPGPSIRLAVRQPTMQELSDFVSYLPRSISDGINHSSTTYPLADGYPEEYDEYGERTPYWIDPQVWWHTPACSLVIEEFGSLFETEKPFAEHLIVDMEQSDETLRESFDTMLCALRKNQGFSDRDRKNKGKILFDRWARYSIIPFLDLEQWGNEEQVHISNKIFSSALSKFRPIVGDSNVRKTIRPTALSAITRSTLMRLESFVASSNVVG